MKTYSILTLLAILLVSCAPAFMPAPTSTAIDTPRPTEASTPIPTVVPQSPFVKVDGHEFTVNNQPFRFIGANAENFGYYEKYGLSIDEAIRSAADNRIRVLRISLAFANNTRDIDQFEEFDKVVDLAGKYGVYLIVNLGEGCCRADNGAETPESYFLRFPYANLTSEPALIDFEGFIKSVLLRRNTVNGRVYRDDPTILAWDVMNEPALELFSDSEFHIWLDKVTTYIKTLDSNHLVTIGIYSTSDAYYQALNVPGLDFFSFHYNMISYTTVDSNLDSIRYRVEALRAMGKPVVLEEFGVHSQRIFPDNVSSAIIEAWLRAYKEQLDTAFSTGASGALFWGWGVPETKKVLLWWRQEDHDASETEFVKLIREYQMPTIPPAPGLAATIVTPLPTQVVPSDFYVYASCTLSGMDKQVHVTTSTPVVILWGWKASTYAQLQDYLDNAITTVTLDDKNISAHAPFGIAGNDPGNYKLLYFAQVGILSAGTHKLIFDESWKKMINDGTNSYGPGSKHETQHDECEIVVK